jgi:hypothetical protein
MEASKCPKCGDEPHFVESVEKWYCYGCNSYIEDDEQVHTEADHADNGTEEQTQEIAHELHELEQDDVTMCTKCGAALEKIKDGKLYCYVCEAYPEESAEAAEAEPQQAIEPEVKADETVVEAKAILESIPDPVPIQVPVTPAAEPEPEKKTDVKSCSVCGQPMKWIEKYQRDYCYGCRKYAVKLDAVSPAPSAKPEDDGHKHCPGCRGELKFIEKYNEYYCFACKKYPLREKKKPAPAANPNACPKCGGELKLVEKYQRHYCYTCKEYAPKSNGSGASAEKKVCPTCNSEMKYVPEYNEWYCYKCKKYSLRPAKPVLLF